MLLYRECMLFYVIMLWYVCVTFVCVFKGWGWISYRGGRDGNCSISFGILSFVNSLSPSSRAVPVYF